MIKPTFIQTVLGTCIYFDKNDAPTHMKSFTHAFEHYLAKLTSENPLKPSSPSVA